ncbi:PREDICTED: uncharacterized protein LOC109464217 [Branchiostoma belcheri]|uniref:Uncharacterized protein LOC109464217 n=1 Tax=Branchiostoma belcheri TaxID=7741 RepID=A0A6P4XJK0_BRABE|nr:PREDICTED: uncharacterized protein LOC109464217 [Branchiostoma belcheri]
MNKDVAPKVGKFVTGKNYFCEKFRDHETSDLFTQKWDYLENKYPFWAMLPDTSTGPGTSSMASTSKGKDPSTAASKGKDSSTATSKGKDSSTAASKGKDSSTATSKETTLPGDVMETIKRHFVGTYSIPIQHLKQPAWKRLVRVADRQHVDKLKKVFVHTSVQATILIGNICNITAEQFEESEINNYEYEVIGGNHTRIALQEILQETPDQLENTTVHLNVYCGLPDDMAKRLGMDHNNAINCSKPETTLDRLTSFRASLYNKAGYSSPDDISSVEPPTERATLSAWKDGLAIMLGCGGLKRTDKRKQLNNIHRRAIYLASAPCDVFNGVTEFARKWGLQKIHGQKKGELRPVHFEFLTDSDLDHVEQASLLQDLVEGKADYAEEIKKLKKSKAEKKKVKERSEKPSAEGEDTEITEEVELEANGDGNDDGLTEQEKDATIKKLKAEVQTLRGKNRKLEEGIKTLQKEKGGVEKEMKKVKEQLAEQQIACQLLQNKLHTDEEVSRGLLFSLEQAKDGDGVEREKEHTSNKRKTTDVATTSAPRAKSQRTTCSKAPPYKVDDYVVVAGAENNGQDIVPWFARVIATQPSARRLTVRWHVLNGEGVYVRETKGGKLLKDDTCRYDEIACTVQMSEDMTLPVEEMTKALKAVKQ